MKKEDFAEIQSIVDDAIEQASTSSDLFNIEMKLDDIERRFNKQDEDLLTAFEWLGDKIDKLGAKHESR